MSNTDQFQPRKKTLYQFADGLSNYFVFPQIGLTIDTKGGLKTNYVNNRLGDGLVNLSVKKEFKKDAYIYTITFLIKKNDYFDIDYVKSVFWNGYRQLAFFYDLDKNGYISFYWNYLTVTNSFLEKVNPKEEYNQENIPYTVELTAEYPYIYACDSSLAYFDKNAFVINERTYDVGNYDIGIYDPGINVATVAISGLTLAKRQELFFSCENADNALVYTDRFFNPTSYTISSDLVINQTLTTNNSTDIQTTNTLADTTAYNKIYIIEITQMSQNNTLLIQNMTNNTGILFTWLNAVNSPALFYYNSFKNRCYQANGTILPLTDIKIEQIDSDFLYFNPKRTLNAVISTFRDSIRLQKNSSSNITVKIEALKTYH